jgi:hypothetical protein
MCKMIGREQPAQRITYPVVAKGFSAYDIVERATSEVRGFSFSWKQSTSLRCSKLAPNRAMRIHDQHGAEQGSAKQEQSQQFAAATEQFLARSGKITLLEG